MVRRRWKDLAPSVVQTQEPKTKVSLRLKARVRHEIFGEIPYLAHQLSVF
jgi:hypothetical protein